MAAIAELAEDFEGGAAGNAVTTGNTIATAVTGTPTFIADPYHGSKAGRFYSATTVVSSMTRTLTAPRAFMWLALDLNLISGPGAICNAVAWWSGSQRIGTLKVRTDGKLAFQDGSPAGGVNIWISTTSISGGYAEVFLLINTNNASGHRVQIYIGADRGGSTPTEDSGALALTNTGSSVTQLSFGVQTATTAELHIDNIRADGASQPATQAPPSSGPALSVQLEADKLNFVDAYSPVTLTAAAVGGTGPYSYSWSQSGAAYTVPLSGSGSTRPFAAPPCIYPAGLAITFSVTVTDSLGATATDTLTVAIAPHNDWTVTSLGEWVPYQNAVIESGVPAEYYSGAPTWPPIGSVPTSLAASNVASGASVPFTWTQVADPSTAEPVTGYALIDAATGRSVAEISGKVGAYSLAGLGDGAYRWTLVARTALRYTGPSTPVTFSVGTPAVLAAPTGFAATVTVAGPPATVSCSWTASADPSANEPVLSYTVLDNGVPAHGTSAVDADTTNTTITVPSGTHVLGVVANTGARSSAESNTVTEHVA